MENPKIKIESDGKYVHVWVDGEEIKDIVQMDFHASANEKGVDIICSYWKHVRTEGGRLLVLNNELITEKVIVSE